MHSAVLNTLSSILVAAIIYLVACLIDMQTQAITETFKDVQISDIKGNVLDTFHDKHIHLKVKRGQLVSFNVRSYTNHNAHINVKRYLVNTAGVKRELTEMNFETKAGQNSDTVVVYPIPMSAPVGCGYTLYSRIEIVYPFNILTLISPITKGIALGSSFCIID